ncbi:hypothetical protein [Nonomuraea longicatena]|uniref:Uncharacterized protein n=1 Tax=Nonomuraea longicatena TaxID=83682 RepID=A0ABN1R9P7_9ACTN
MYGWIWRKLPGATTTARVVAASVLAAVTAAVLWYAAFPLLEPAVPLDEVTVRK